MTDKEIRRLDRQELLSLLLELEKENTALRQALEDAEKELQNKRIDIDNAGSLAAAALSLNHVFETADTAAQQYIDNIREKSEKIDTLYEDIKAEAEENAAKIIADAYAQRDMILEDTTKYTQSVVSDMRERLNLFYTGHPDFRDWSEKNYRDDIFQ